MQPRRFSTIPLHIDPTNSDRWQMVRGKTMVAVVHKIVMKETSAAVTAWHYALMAVKARERGERIMQRVGLRLLNREVADAIFVWREQQLEEKGRLRAEGIMRRVGGRLRNSELALNWGEFVSNWNSHVLNCEQNKMERVRRELQALRLRWDTSQQVILLLLSHSPNLKT